MNDAWFRRLVELSPEASYVVRDNKLVYLNPAALRLFGARAASEMLGRDVLTWVAPEFHALALARRRRVEDEGQSVPLVEMQFLRMDGTPFEVEIHAAPLEDESNRAIVATIRDVTARRALERRLRHAEASEAVGRLAGGIAHDFNNTLSVILGHAELAMLDLDPAAPIREDLQKIANAAQRSAALAQQLLAYARQQANTPQLLNVNRVVSEALDELRVQLSTEVALEWDAAPDLWTIAMDPAQLHQLISSLCLNAQDAIRQKLGEAPGRGAIRLSTRNRDLRRDPQAGMPQRQDDEFVQLRVSDTGHGVPAALRERIFEPFFTTREVGEGTGLGLAMVHGIVQQNHGFLQLSSPPGSGAIFDIFLPLHRELP